MNLLNKFSELAVKHYEVVIDTAGQEITNTEKNADAANSASLVDMSKNLLTSLASLEISGGIPGYAPPLGQTAFSIRGEGLKELHPDTANTLAGQQVDLFNQPIGHATRKLEDSLAENGQKLDALYQAGGAAAPSVRRVGNTFMMMTKRTTPSWQEAFANGEEAAPVIQSPSSFSSLRELKPKVNVIGVADLLVVKQQLIGYQKTDIAHVENILKGEVKTRDVTKRQEVELTTFRESETTTSVE